MKRIISLFLMSLMLGACVLSFGCDRFDTEARKFKKLDKLLSPKNPVTIRYWHYYNQGPMERIRDLVDEFNATVGIDRGILVEQESLSNPGNIAAEIAKIVNGEVTERVMPDLFQTYTDTAFSVNESFGLADIEYYLTQAERAEYVDSYFDEGIMGEGGSKIFPVAKSTEILVLSKNQWDDFAEEVPEVSLDDLATYEGITKVAGLYYEWCGKAFFGRDAFANMMVIGMKQQGEEIISLEGAVPAVSTNKAAYRKIWDNMYVPYINGYFMGSSGYRSTDMGIGNIIAYIGSSSSASSIPEEIRISEAESVDNEILVLPSPHFRGTSKFAVQQGAGVAITKSTAAREYASAIFLKWLTEIDRNIDFALATGYMPVKKAAQDIEVIKGNELYTNASDKIKKVHETTFAMMQSHSFFAAKGYKNGAVIRDNLLETKTFTANAEYNQSLIYKYVTDLQTKTVEECLSDANFDDWFNKFTAAVTLEIAK